MSRILFLVWFEDVQNSVSASAQYLKDNLIVSVSRESIP